MGTSPETGKTIMVSRAGFLLIINEIDSGAVGDPGFGAEHMAKTSVLKTLTPDGTKAPRGSPLLDDDYPRASGAGRNGRPVPPETIPVQAPSARLFCAMPRYRFIPELLVSE